jgi:hypothetical protein
MPESLNFCHILSRVFELGVSNSNAALMINQFKECQINSNDILNRYKASHHSVLVGSMEHIAPLEEHCRNSENTTFQEREKYNFSRERKNYWPGRCNRINRTTLVPLAAILANRRVTLLY